MTLDFTEAVITHDTLRIDVAMTLTLITRPGVVVDADGLLLVHTKAKYRQEPTSSGLPPTLRVELVGAKSLGCLVVRPARRTFAQWLLRSRLHGADRHS
ncbi:hypothetical protein [Streptomyces hyaluromycini]|uniref:hypothetical protein n=1 Tax=Streptomyces hyaluromycini TaxID=1377993 RepID=UPI001238098C|nr:hypothetical protein [Streptomyces hyaluromycini]